MLTFLHWLTQLFGHLVTFLETAFLHCTQPSRPSMVLSTAIDLTHSKAELIAEKPLLRQQLIVLHGKSKSPRFLNPIASASSFLLVA